MRTKKNVLLIEDSQNLALFLSELLKINGYDVVCFNSFNDAMDYMRNNEDHFEIALVDYYVGDATGYEIARAIREKMKYTYIILMTAYSSKAKVKELSEAKIIDGLVSKPFRFQELMDVIKNCDNTFI